MVMAAPQASTIELFLSKINALSLDGGKLSWLPRHIQLGNADHKKNGSRKTRFLTGYARKPRYAKFLPKNATVRSHASSAIFSS